MLFIKVSSKCIIDLDRKCKTVKFVEYKIGRNVGDVRFRKNFSDTIEKSMFNEEKTWNSLKLNTFALLKTLFSNRHRLGENILKRRI